MNRPLIVLPEAQDDLLQARDWYDHQKPGLGDVFSTRVSEAFEQLSARPELFGVILKDVRACRLRKFPYVVYYRILTDRVEIQAVLHGRRNPSASRSRV